MPHKPTEIDFRLLCAWLLPACKPGSSVGLQLASGEEYEKEKAGAFASGIGAFGLEPAAIPDCDVLLAVETGLRQGGKDYSRMLEEFSESRAQKMFLFCLNWLAKSAFAMKLLDANRLDCSILLPGFAVLPNSAAHFSLLILDKARRAANDRTARRDANDRTKILFLDASGMDIRGLRDAAKMGDRETARQIVEKAVSDLPRAENDFRDLIICKEPLLASYHCARMALENALGSNSDKIDDCVEIIKCPSFFNTRDEKSDGECIELSCLSPRDFAPYGFTTAPSGAEKKRFPAGRVKAEQRLRANDILLVSQSNVGKLCIVDDSFKKGAWTGSSFTWILRPKNHDLDPRILYIYLGSAAVNAYLSACSCGSGLPMLPVQSFRSLPVPSFSKEEKAYMIECFDNLDKIRRDVAGLKSQARALLSDSYGVS